MDGETCLGQAPGFRGTYLNIRVDRVRKPSGDEGVCEVLEHPGSVAVLAITVDGFAVLIRQHRYAIGQDLLELPAGILDPGETPAVAAARELWEETGYHAATLSPLAEIYPSAGYTNERLVIFRADDCRPGVRPVDRDEPLDLVLLTQDEVRTLLNERAIHDAKTLVALPAWIVG